MAFFDRIFSLFFVKVINYSNFSSTFLIFFFTKYEKIHLPFSAVDFRKFRSKIVIPHNVYINS